MATVKRLRAASWTAPGGRAALLVSLLLCAAPGAVRGDSVVLLPARDNTLIQDPLGAWSNGSGPALFTGRTAQSSGSIRRALIAFDLNAAIPSGSRITAATLTLSLASEDEASTGISVHALSSAWGEGASSASGGRGAPSAPGDATWIHAFFDGRLWESAGGDFLGTVLAMGIADLPGATTFGSSAELVADVQRWLDAPGDNHGWILLGDETSPSTVRRFGSREQIDPALRPMLRIEYSPPCAPAPLGPSDWHRQCLMLDDGLPGRGAGPPQPSVPLEPGFVAEIAPCADALLAALGAAASACEAVLDRPLGDACDRADRHLAALALNLCAGRLQTSCVIGPQPPGCGDGDIGGLLEAVAAWVMAGDCRHAHTCAAAAQPRP